MADSPLSSSTAKKLSRLGAAKGGMARNSVLTAEERRDIARRAIATRWAKAGKTVTFEVDPEPEAAPASAGDAVPYSLLRGKLQIGDVEMECHVLSNGSRVLTQREMVRLLSGGRESGNLAAYIDTNPLVSNDFAAGRTIQFNVPGINTPATGYEATLLIELCESYLEARNKKLLKSGQIKLAVQAEIIVRACAKVGIVALIDEATGFQKVRAKNALQVKLQAFIAEEMQEWVRLFPQEFWLELARLEGIRYSPTQRPLRWGRYVMKFVYDAVDQDVGNTLRELNPDPQHGRNHHQWLERYGRQRVNDHLQRVIAVMKLCRNMDDFREKFAHVFARSPLQEAFDFEESKP